MNKINYITQLHYVIVYVIVYVFYKFAIMIKVEIKEGYYATFHYETFKKKETFSNILH